MLHDSRLFVLRYESRKRNDVVVFLLRGKGRRISIDVNVFIAFFLLAGTFA